MQTVKKNLDTISLLKHILDSAKERLKDTEIDPDYREILKTRIPELEDKIRVLEQSIN